MRKSIAQVRGVDGAPRAGTYAMTPDDLVEFEKCSPRHGAQGFFRFCERHCKIKCRLTGEAIPFKMWPAQKDVATLLVAGAWLWIVKARQLGITWIVTAFIVWQLTYVTYFGAVVINQSLIYAKNFLAEKVRFIYDHLPLCFQHRMEVDTSQYYKFGTGGKGSHGSSVAAIAGNENAARSDSLNFFFADEASRIEGFESCLRATQPTLMNTDGQAVVLSSSAGPIGLFYNKWVAIENEGLADQERLESLGFPEGKTYFPKSQIFAGPSRWVGIFLSWDAHPDRDQAWYVREAAENAEDPNYMRQEFPESAEEAFEAAGGRIYPSFKRKDVGKGGHLLHIPSLDRAWPRYRAIDWGETSCFVTLWLVQIPSPTPMLTVDPSCTNLVAEMLGYSWKEDTNAPLKVEDHGPDALRYAVVTFGLHQHVHVYREWYVRNATAKGYDASRLCAGIRERSGWELADPATNEWELTEHTEQYEGTVFDRAKPMLINELAQYDIMAWPHIRPSKQAMANDEEVVSGIRLVQKLVISHLPYEVRTKKTDEQITRERDRHVDVLRNRGVRTTPSLLTTIKANREQERRQAAMRKRRTRIGRIRI